MNRSDLLISMMAALPFLASTPALAQSEFNKQLEDTAAQREVRTIYTAKKILTMDRSNPSATAVAVAGKRIIAAGSLDEVKAALSDRKVKAALGDREFVVDETFASKVVMPGFIDQHLHPILGSLTLAIEVIAPEKWVLPRGTFEAANDQAEYRKRLREAEAKLKDPDEWLLTWGYHALWHGELNREALDAINRKRPIAVWHRSCHEFYLNTAGLNALKITAEMTQGQGQASEQANWQEGHFWEAGMKLMIDPMLKVLATPERLASGLKQMVAYLHSKGVTAYNEPGALYTPDMWKLYVQILGADDTPMYSTFVADGRSIPDRVGLDNALQATEEQIAVAPECAGSKLMFFPKQVKLFADGAIISQLMQMKEGYLDGHKGEWIMPPDQLEERARLYWNAGYQLHIHVNGDAGLDTVLDVLERRMRESPRADHRTVIVHMANSTEEQLGRIARLGAIVSVNPYYPVGFADMYGKVGLGQPRADVMVRSASVLKRHIPLSFHSDLPMAYADPLALASFAVNRSTPSVRVAGPEQRIGVEDALRAVTIEAAYSWRKENEIGSIAPGKIANFTVLEEDPLAVEPTNLADVPIWGTVFEGRLFPIPAEPRRSAAVHGNSKLGHSLALGAHEHGGDSCNVARMIVAALSEVTQEVGRAGAR